MLLSYLCLKHNLCLSVFYYGRRAVKTHEFVSVCVRAFVCVRECFDQIGAFPQELTQKLSWVQHMDVLGRGA